LDTAFRFILLGGLVSAVFVFVSLFFVVAPYGRHIRKGWGPSLPAQVGWIVMESPSVFLFAYWCISGPHGISGAALLLFLMWELHYVHRTFIWPFRLRAHGKRTPVFIVLSAIGFNLYNAYINGRWIGDYSGGYTWEWVRDPRFVVGTIVFFSGMAINMHADHVLFTLRKPGETDYKVPQGGLYRWISCPNYLGEILEWSGWAIAAWSPAGLVFAIWTFANLAPRALSNHRWNVAKVPGYPAKRWALVPYLF
jgi:3-oxo-5-alpha-steroid 4-dehydrogenase 1